MKEKTNLAFLPTDGEHLRAYVKRLQDVIQQIRYDDSAPHDKWYTHYSSGPCYICEMLDMLDYMQGILTDIVNYDKKHEWVCVRPEDSHDALTFSFKFK